LIQRRRDPDSAIRLPQRGFILAQFELGATAPRTRNTRPAISALCSATMIVAVMMYVGIAPRR